MSTTEVDLGQTRNFYGMLTAVTTISDSPILLSGIQNINGAIGFEGARVFVNGQTNQIENGIYNMSSGSWERALDSENGDDLGSILFKIETGNLGNELWEVDQKKGNGIIGTNAISAQVSVVMPTGGNTDYFVVGTLNTNTEDHIQDNTLLYKSWTKFVFAGTDNFQPALSAGAIIWVEQANKPSDLRVRDITNNNNIVEILNITNTTPQIVEINGVQNLPVGRAIFEVQLRTQQTGGKYNFSGFFIGTNT
jgi:hypothetical protein